MNDLVELASRGDREAFAALATASIDRLFAIARRILQDHDRAQDAVQTRSWVRGAIFLRYVMRRGSTRG